MGFLSRVATVLGTVASNESSPARDNQPDRHLQTTMAPPHTSRIQREDRNAEIYSLHKNTNWGYNRIAKATGVARSTIRSVVKRGDERDGDV